MAEQWATSQPGLLDVARLFDPARLTQARQVCKMSKTELHDAVGVSAAAIGQYERGEMKPRAETIALLADARDFLIPLLVFVPALFAAIVIFATVFRTPLSDRGAELRDHLEGLRLYIRVAERDRIRILQSPEGAERAPVDTSDTGLMLTLYERVLPYAVLFDEEKQWAKTLGEYYDEQPPEWYSGSNAFSAGVFAAGISSVSSFTSASYSGTSSSSSSGSSGGGSSGGGGGGGGGGSW